MYGNILLRALLYVLANLLNEKYRKNKKLIRHTKWRFLALPSVAAE